MSGLADANRKIVEAVHQDAGAAFAAIDKLAGAQSLSDAYAVYVDYLREQTNVGVGRAQAVVSFVSTKASEGFDAARDGLTKVLPMRSQAA